MVTSNKMGRALHDEILRRWKDKGLFASQTSVKSSQFTDASTFRSTLSGHQEGESSILLQILSGITLTVIPHAVDSKMDLRHSLKNAETGCVFEASAGTACNTVVGLPRLPASPFAQGGHVRTFDRLANELYFQLASQGAFDPGARCDTSSPEADGPVE